MAGGEGRVEWLSGPEYCSDRGLLLCGGFSWWLGLGRGLRSLAVAHRRGGGRAARIEGPWILECGFESYHGV